MVLLSLLEEDGHTNQSTAKQWSLSFLNAKSKNKNWSNKSVVLWASSISLCGWGSMLLVAVVMLETWPCNKNSSNSLNQHPQLWTVLASGYWEKLTHSFGFILELSLLVLVLKWFKNILEKLQFHSLPLFSLRIATWVLSIFSTLDCQCSTKISQTNV